MAKALQDMNIQRDLANRWFRGWAAHLKVPMPSDLPAEFLTPEARKGTEQGRVKEDDGKKDYIIDEHDNPQYVGEGNGSFGREYALDLAKIKAGRRVTGADAAKRESPGDALASRAVEKVIQDMQAGGQNLPVDETAKVLSQVKALQEILGMGDKPKSGDDIGQILTAFKSLKEIFGDNKPPASIVQPRQMLIDRNTGKIEEVQPGNPIIIQTMPAASQSQSVPIQIKDKDGNPMVFDIETLFRLEDHRDKGRREEESHQTRMDIAKGYR